MKISSYELELPNCMIIGKTVKQVKRSYGVDIKDCNNKEIKFDRRLRVGDRVTIVDVKLGDLNSFFKKVGIKKI